MDMQGSRELAVDRPLAWEALNDPQVLKACIPGCDRIEATGENRYAIGMTVKVGPVSAKFTGKIQLEDVQPPERYTLRFEGQGGAAGFGKGVAQVQLTPRAGGCTLDYTANAQVGGKIAQVGQRLIDGVARAMAEDFFKRFEAQLQQRHPEAFAQAAAASASESHDAGHAAAAAGPASAPPTGGRGGIPAWAWIAGAIVLVGLAAWLAR
jgi:hypothetical protein